MCHVLWNWDGAGSCLLVSAPEFQDCNLDWKGLCDQGCCVLASALGQLLDWELSWSPASAFPMGLGALGRLLIITRPSVTHHRVCCHGSLPVAYSQWLSGT